MVEELGERHGPPGLRQFGQPLTDGIVEGELSARYERERGGSAERFRHARETHVVVDVDRPPRFKVRDPRGVDIDRFSSSHNYDDTGRATTLAGHEALQRALQRALVLIPRRSQVRTECQTRGGSEYDEELHCKA